MLMVVDVGNTDITVGFFKGEELKATFRMVTRESRTSDEYGMFICNLAERKGIKIEEIEDVIMGSVVPDIMYSLTRGIIKYLNIHPMIVGPGTKTGIRVTTVNPKEIGADRIIDAVAAYEIYGGPVLVVDFGTASTYDLITEDGTFLAGVTAPGISISAKALWQDAAKLPKIEIKKPDSILAKETISSMQAGLVFGTIGQTEYIITHMIKESGLKNVKIVATGGLGKIISDETESIQYYDNMLTLKGLRIIYNKCKKN
ncbi:MAG TPA: type III pantothenate kinase [Candidatus Merdenecus merdavium]|nr:type III pantothenate kinase [Candidatus Merdenecus merdavium]